MIEMCLLRFNKRELLNCLKARNIPTHRIKNIMENTKYQEILEDEKVIKEITEVFTDLKL